MREKLKAARKAKGLTQAAVAECLKKDLRYYKKIEYGEALGSIALWDALEDLLETNQRILREIS
jgi:Helix-turn-helix.